MPHVPLPPIVRAFIPQTSVDEYPIETFAYVAGMLYHIELPHVVGSVVPSYEILFNELQ